MEIIDEALANSGWFQTLDAGLRSTVREAARLRRLRDGAAVYRQGDAPDGLYMVMEGQIRLTSYSEEGAGFLILVAASGDWFGEVSTLDDGPRQQDAIAHGMSIVLHIPSAELDRIGGEASQLWRAIGRVASQHQRTALLYIRNLISMPAQDRVAAMLKALDSRQPGLPFKITHDEIAANLGLSRQTVNAALQRLQCQGLVRLGYRNITVLGCPARSDFKCDRY